MIRQRVADHDQSLAVLLELDGQRFTFEPSGETWIPFSTNWESNDEGLTDRDCLS
jgi:hypothetical protein